MLRSDSLQHSHIKTEMAITIVPVGEVDEDVVLEIAERLRKRFDHVFILEERPVPATAFNRVRKQYNSLLVLHSLREVSGDIVLGVTSVDLYAEGLNFVFGRAEVGGKYCIISTARLQHHDRKIFYDRAEKEAVHEIGHVIGLGHCPDIKCVMHFSNSVFDTDIKGAWFCERCLDMLRRNN
ncbi:MAG: archaemetzincin family Zn-dependent metalloprotease [Methanomassiliicoccales archaeon]|jgi:archaemetzincin|nr:archaemetzincin family Zn-dependent metalloprotease [Methanomassiliicoccales archaeon]